MYNYSNKYKYTRYKYTYISTEPCLKIQISLIDNLKVID